jgi:hypothetical protein
MIAAVLPLPANPMKEMRERDNSTSNLDESNEGPNDYTRQFGPMDEARYESAKWWRNLNRWMTVVGVMIIAAIVSDHLIPANSDRLMQCRSSWLLSASERGGN